MIEAIIGVVMVLLIGVAIVFARRDAAGGIKTKQQTKRAETWKILANQRVAKNLAALRARARARRRRK